MNVWIVNPFDPLPGDPEQPGRYATLARLLAGRGHAVTWWTSSFSHRFKRPVDQEGIRAACAPLGIRPLFLEAPPYSGNVSLRRVWNHRALVRRFLAEATLLPAPEVVLASSPPPALAEAAGIVGHQHGAKVIVDVQDLWPDNFRRLVPGLLRPVVDVALRPAVRTARRAYGNCDALAGVAGAYVERALQLANGLEGPSRSASATGASPVSLQGAGAGGKPVAVVPLGVDLDAFDQAADEGCTERWTKPPGQTWLAYTGSLSHNYDFLTIVRAAALLHERHGNRVRIILTGRGELADEAARIVRDQRLDNVALTGFIDFNTWAYLLTQCDAGFNAALPEALIYLPNKVFYYLAAGIAVLNTIPGECSRIIREGDCGLDYPAGDVAGCAAAVDRLLADDERRAAMGRAARDLAETKFDRRVLFPRFVEFIERVGEGKAGAEAGLS